MPSQALLKNLNSIMSIDHVIRVHDDGTISDVDNVHAPTLFDDELDDPRWSFFSTGYTGQYGYNGPVMHDSEYIGGALARDILETPGVYAAIVSSYTDDDEDADNITEGWAIVRLNDDAS